MKNERGEWGVIIELSPQAGAKMNWLTNIYRGENLIVNVDGKIIESAKLFDEAIGQTCFCNWIARERKQKKLPRP